MKVWRNQLIWWVLPRQQVIIGSKLGIKMVMMVCNPNLRVEDVPGFLTKIKRN